MKKIRLSIVLLLVTLLLSSCFGKNDSEVLDAKKDMGIIVEDNKNVEEDETTGIIDTGGLLEESNDSPIQTEKKEENILIENLTDNKFLEFDDLSGKKLLSGEVEITGKTLTSVDKIIVYFTNKESDFPDDKFTLKQFKSGDETFLYRAFSRYETLDFGKNEFIFESYSGEETSKLSLVINVRKEEKIELKTSTVELTDFKNLPVGDDYGNPKELGNGKITYSDLKGLEIGKVTEKFFDCDVNSETEDYYVSEYLEKITSSYYWWNTCRPFSDNKGTSFFVLKLDGNNYIYEKHIFLSNGIYGIYDLESGDSLVLGTDSVQEKNAKLKVKNDELKEKNEEYNNLDILDKLFKNLVNN